MDHFYGVAPTALLMCPYIICTNMYFFFSSPKNSPFLSFLNYPSKDLKVNQRKLTHVLPLCVLPWL